MNPAPIPVGEGARAGGRALWLDALRGAAVLLMIQTHVVHTLLAAEWRQASDFARLEYLGGLVAPLFLWIAGYAAAMAADRRVARGQSPAGPTRRLWGLLVLGYLLHFPVPGSGATVREFFAVDVLSCLAVSLLAVAAWHRWAPRLAEAGVAVMALLVVGAVLLPAAALSDTTGFWPLDAWIDQSGESLFPIVPWAGFVFVGYLMARWPLGWSSWVIAGLALAMVPASVDGPLAPLMFFIRRAGWLMVVAGGARALAIHLPVPNALVWCGRQSLVLYVVHLSLLFHLPVARRIGATLDPAATAFAVAMVAGASVGITWSIQAARRQWRRRRAGRPA